MKNCLATNTSITLIMKICLITKVITTTTNHCLTTRVITVGMKNCLTTRVITGGGATKCRSHCHYDHELSFWNISGHSLSYACTSLLLLSFGRHYYGLITSLTLSGPFQIIFQILIGYLYDIQINDNNAIGSLCLYLFGNNPVFHVYLNSVILKIWCIFRVLNGPLRDTVYTQICRICKHMNLFLLMYYSELFK